MLFTIFTPTYNRAYILPYLYESLLQQISQNFEWLIIDDGSTDNTETLVKQYINEGKVPIRYFKQKNQGKHIAINNALKLVELPWFVVIDSDDYLRPEAAHIWEKLTHEVKDDKIAGFSFIHFSDKISYSSGNYGKKRLSRMKDYVWEFPGEMLYCFKTSIITKFPFPVFNDEKFCQETVLLRPLFRKYRMVFTDNVLVHGEYLEDGLSQNHYALMLKNPKYGLLSIQEYFLDAQNTVERKELAKAYWDIVLKSKKIPITKAILGIPIFYTIEIFKGKLMKRIFKHY